MYRSDPSYTLTAYALNGRLYCVPCSDTRPEVTLTGDPMIAGDLDGFDTCRVCRRNLLTPERGRSWNTLTTLEKVLDDDDWRAGMLTRLATPRPHAVVR